MILLNDRSLEPAAIRVDLGAIFVSMELSRSSWVITSLLPGGGEKMSRHTVPGGDVAALMARFTALQDKARLRTGHSFPIIVIQEAGLDGFWIHRVLEKEGIESHVVDPASIATSRRRRRAKTDKLDGETLVRTLLAFKRGDPRVCAMVRVPCPGEEDCRRISRERKVLTTERISHVNRIKGLLFAQGVTGYEPLRRDRRERLEELRTGDGRPFPRHIKAQIVRELDRLELVIAQVRAIEAERDAALTQDCDPARSTVAKMLLQLKGIGAEGGRHSLFRMSLAPVRQPPTGRRLCRSRADPLAERVGQPRTGCLESRQSPIALDNDPTVMALVAASATICADPMVSCSGRQERWTDA